MKWSRRTWRCPYFGYDEKHCVHCKGGSKVKLPNVEAFKQFADAYCSSAAGWEDCPIAQALMEAEAER